MLGKEQKELYDFSKDTAQILKENTNLKAEHYYLCGNPNMISEITERLKSQGVVPEDIFAEEFKVSVQTPSLSSGGVVGGAGFEPAATAM